MPDGLANFRDLGGLPTADGRRVVPGRLFRSDAPHRMSDADVAAWRNLGVAALLDLRAPDEVALVGIGPAAALPLAHHVLPVRAAILTAGGDARPPAPTAVEHYARYLEEGPDAFRGVVEVLTTPGVGPAVICCNAGKDRTGVVVAMVLDLLGVPDPEIAADYARTQAGLDAIRAATRRDYPTDPAAWRRLAPDLAHARAETMLGFLARVRDDFGGWPAYLAGLGVTPDRLEALRRAYLGEGPGAAPGGGATP